jgi:hypothetical protein
MTKATTRTITALSMKIISVTVVLAVLFPMFFTVSAATENPLPLVTSFRGTAHIQRSGSLREFTVFRNTEVKDGNTIITGVNSSVTVSYGDNEFVVGSNSKIFVSEIWSRRGREISDLHIIEGSVLNRVKREPNPNCRNTIRTANAIVGVRGTEYILGYSRIASQGAEGDNPFTLLAVFEGQVRLDVDNFASFIIDTDMVRLIHTITQIRL